MLKTEKRRVKIGSDGLLHLKMPAEIADTEIEIEFAWEPVQTKKVDDNGWPIGFFDRTYGALADDPIERPEQLPLEEREPLE